MGCTEAIKAYATKAKDRQFHIFALVCVVGISSWMLINGMYGELAALVPALPEGWSLPSYICIAVEASNISPLIYTILVSLLVSRKITQKRVDTISTGVVMLFNTLICIITATCWSRHPLLASHSGMLIFCAFASGLAATLSTICMFAFASRFPNSNYTVMLQIGMVLSGTIPGIIGLIQSPGQSYQHFSVEGYFWGLFILFVFCCVGFVALATIREELLFYDKVVSTDAENGKELDVTEEAKTKEEPKPEEGSKSEEKSKPEEKSKSEEESKHEEEPKPEEESKPEAETAPEKKSTEEPTKKYRWYDHYWMDYTAIFILNFVENGALTQIVTYAAMPFGSLALEMSTVLSITLAPLACFFAIFVKYKPNGVILCSAVLVPFVYVLTVAKLAPHPFLSGTHDTAGGTLIVFFYVIDKIFLSYGKAALWARLFDKAFACKNVKTGSRITRFGGLAQQGGSFVGAILFFCLINYTQAFRAF